MAEARSPSTAMRDGTRVHADADLTLRSSSGSARKLLKATTSTGYLKGQKRDVDRLKVPACIKPDVCYKQGYLSGYTESSSSWSFFTQWNEVLFRCDGSVLQHGPKCCLGRAQARLLRLIRARLGDPGGSRHLRREDGHRAPSHRLR